MKDEHQNTHGKFKVSIIEDNEIHREWLKTELSDEKKIKVISSDRFGRDGMESARHYKPNIVLLDFQLEDMTGLEVAKRIKTHNAEIKIFALTAHTEISIIERIISNKNIDALAIKGSRYFETNFISAIIHVIEGGTYLDPSLLTNLRESINSNLNKLTDREFEIFIQSNAGKTDEKIAEDLCIELSHVRNLKSRIAKKIKDANIDNLISKLINNSLPDPFCEELYFARP
ncbi:MAG TPA: response regulator transcription factor [Gammaproteobacteria bacterium]|nr:response regulator transcription factor [Gammaproteobacteria bacterium]